MMPLSSCAVIWCSTPFGIKENRTRRASVVVTETQSGCSTPFGIKENRTGPSWPCRSVEVLNAFRHQRESHRPVRGGPPRSPRVLNAFRHQRESHNKLVTLPFHVLCSTPFGIKENRTQTKQGEGVPEDACSTPFGIKENRTRNVGRSDRVLNAFRHQRESHLKTKCAPDRKNVLNAFRHQRESHKMRILRPVRGHVLNAFRHQRESHTSIGIQ